MSSIEILQHRKALWRKPALYHDGKMLHEEDENREEKNNQDDLVKNFKPHRGEIWYELFYDLIYVAAAGEIGKLAEHDTTPWSLIKCGIIFAVLRDVSFSTLLLLTLLLSPRPPLLLGRPGIN